MKEEKLFQANSFLGKESKPHCVLRYPVPPGPTVIPRDEGAPITFSLLLNPLKLSFMFLEKGQIPYA